MAKRTNPTAQTDILQPTESVFKTDTVADSELLFSKNNYRLMLIGLVLVILGFILMSGGKMPDANTWDESIIYSFTRITLAPIVILVGLGIEVYAIFAKKS